MLNRSCMKYPDSFNIILIVAITMVTMIGNINNPDARVCSKNLIIVLNSSQVTISKGAVFYFLRVWLIQVQTVGLIWQKKRSQAEINFKDKVTDYWPRKCSPAYGQRGGNSERENSDHRQSKEER